MTRSGYTCIRRVFCWLNISLWVTGFAVVAVALWLKYGFEGYITLLPQYALLSADSILLILGGVTIILAFFGCCGSWFQNRCLLITYFSLIILVFEVEVFLGVIAFIFRKYLGNVLIAELQEGIHQHYNLTHGSNNLAEIWDHVQTDLHCCGVINPTDWYEINAWPEEQWVPDSCCFLPEFGCGRNHLSQKWYSRGCADQIYMWFIERLYIIGIVGLVVAFIQLFGLISSMLLFCTVKKRRNSETYTSFAPNGYA